VPARWCRENTTSRDRSFVALDARGQGRLVGLKLEMQNRSWLRPPLREMCFPRGLGLGMLEGPERIFIDEDDSPSVVGTGTEDFFQGEMVLHLVLLGGLVWLARLLG
jgi:hypothetical protein